MLATILTILPYALLAVGLGLCLFLFGSLKMEMRAIEKRAREKQAALESEIRRLGEAAEQPRPVAVNGCMDLTKRTHALRMERRGESAPTIAAALGVPRNEIDLMLKVQALSSLSQRSGTV